MPPETRLKVYLEGLKETEKWYENIAERCRDARPILHVLKRLMELQIMEQFETEGARSGTPWVQDKPETRQRKIEEELDPRTERRTHALEASLMGGPYSLRRLSKHRTTVGTRLFYARFQGHKRVLMTFIMADEQRYTDIALDWIVKGKGA